MHSRSVRAFLAVLPALAAAALLLLWLGGMAPTQAAGPDVRYVSLTGSDSGLCDSPTNACGTVQRAVDVAPAGAEIHIAAGTYTSTAGTVVAISKELALRGGYSADLTDFDPDVYETVLDGQWAGSVVTMTDAGDIVLQHLTVTHGDGDGNGLQGTGGGGGILAWDTVLHVQRCVITDNAGSLSGYGVGGGIFVDNSLSSLPAEIVDSQIVSNTGGLGNGGAGGLYVCGGSAGSPAVISRNLFEGNVGSVTASASENGDSGGASLSGYFVLDHNTFHDNHAADGPGGGMGGALCLWQTQGGRVEANTFLDNVATEGSEGSGGAIYIYGMSQVTMTNNLLAGNDASQIGGGICLDGWDSGYAVDSLLANNTLVDNTAGAGGEAIVAGQYVTLTLTNNLVAGHTVGITCTEATSHIAADHNLLWDTTDPITGTDAVQQDPLLTPEYRPTGNSPAIDAGAPLPWLTTDLDGNPRPQRQGYDIGAYEAPQFACYLPLVLRGS